MLSREEVLHLARLFRMGLREEEIALFQQQLSSILDYFEVLREVDTTNVEPTPYPLPLKNIFREDQALPPLPREEVLLNAPEREGGFFKVKAVLD